MFDIKMNSDLNRIIEELTKSVEKAGGHISDRVDFAVLKAEQLAVKAEQEFKDNIPSYIRLVKIRGACGFFASIIVIALISLVFLVETKNIGGFIMKLSIFIPISIICVYKAFEYLSIFLEPKGEAIENIVYELKETFLDKKDE